MPPMEGSMGFWGGVVKPGETVKCDPPGEFYYHISQIALEPGELNENVQVFVQVDGKRTLLGALSAEHCPQFAIDLVFEKEFELLHTSKTYSIFFSGYQAAPARRSDSPIEEGDESDEEVPLAIPLYPSSNDDRIKEHSPSKLTALKAAAAASPIPEALVEEREKHGKSKADDDDSEEENGDGSGEGESGDDEDIIDGLNSSDDDDGESSDEEETPSKNLEGKTRPVETPLKTPPQKKAKLATPIIDSKAGTGTSKKGGYVHVATPHPAKQAKKTHANIDMPTHSSGYVHFATPYPVKQAKKTPANHDMSKHSSGYACKSCNKTFNSTMGLEAHSKAKHTAT
ncbi:histone deacetylase HDT2-like [Oryza brachyantha]|uniref:C2H2-type domain-containing protein n=1 Tax=Oryza brachyantha TaxID=4533 RepID=J3L6Z2_ORYBR|nr:histone deacetylase HDT2-like [Oryza brachyantha]